MVKKVGADDFLAKFVLMTWPRVVDRIKAADTAGAPGVSDLRGGIIVYG
jgi:hypothetical protein